MKLTMRTHLLFSALLLPLIVLLPVSAQVPADAGTLGRDLYLRELALRRREPLIGRLFEGGWDCAWLPTEPPAY